MSATKLRELPSLDLDQSGVHPSATLSGDSDRIERWYVHFGMFGGVAYWSCGREYIDSHFGEPFASVEIRLPWLMVGSEADRYSDIREAAQRHAEKHLGPA